MQRRNEWGGQLRVVVCGVIVAVALLGAGCSGSDDEAATDTTESTTQVEEAADEAEPHVSEVYSDPVNWLCRPDREDDACDIDLDATQVNADGTTEVQPFEPLVDAPVDCFYLYPTISTDRGANADRVPESETAIAAQQAARFAEACTLYAPMYRQIPLAALQQRLADRAEEEAQGDDSEEAGDQPQATDSGEIAFADVRDSFLHYLDNDNSGRPYVLIGHSQGASWLRRLIDEEIDDNDERREALLSAMLIGTSVATSDGEEASGKTEFENIPACESADATGCVISYATFYEGEPPPENSLFGRADPAAGTRSLCSNPADLETGGPAPLDTYLAGAQVDGVEINTPYTRFVGAISGSCASTDAADWLELTIVREEGDVWPEDFGGRLSPEWGTHLLDMNFAMGDLVELVKTQSGQS